MYFLSIFHFSCFYVYQNAGVYLIVSMCVKCFLVVVGSVQFMVVVVIQGPYILAVSCMLCEQTLLSSGVFFYKDAKYFGGEDSVDSLDCTRVQ